MPECLKKFLANLSEEEKETVNDWLIASDEIEAVDDMLREIG